ncbi:MAG: hypothetical protein RLZ33_2199 [Bacteroidota bacterium]|jgi:hypothetical protein
MIDQTDSDLELYKQQFDNLNHLVGKAIDEIVLYLEATDENYSEQPNVYGKSLLNGLDIKVGDIYYSIGGRFNDSHYGLIISQGRTTEYEYIAEEKSPINYETKIINEQIKSVDIYWMEIPWNGAVGYYPQEFVIKTDIDFLLISSIEINNGQVNTEFTDEILLIENEEIAQKLQLGQYGINQNEREWFSNFHDLVDAHNKNWKQQ